MIDSAPAPPPSSQGPHRFCLVLAACTLVLISAGGLVTSLGAGLSVPDWPLSWGGVNPPNWLHLPNVRAEHGHRLIAGIVATLTAVLAYRFWRSESRPWARILAYAALVIVILQAVLGGLRVWLYLPLPIVIAHAMLGQTFFCVVAALALFTSRGWRAPAPPASASPGPPTWVLCLLFSGAVYFQLFLGALMRHNDAGLAVMDFPLAYGRLLPDLGKEAIHGYNMTRVYQGLENTDATKIMMHLAHRYWAVVVTSLAVVAVARILRRHINEGALLFPALGVGLLVLLQIVLGAMTVLSGKEAHVATAHVAVGALILAGSVVLSLQSMRLAGVFHAKADAPVPAASPAASRGVSEAAS